MKNWTRFCCFLLAAVMLFSAMPLNTSAAVNENAPVDFVLVLDCSASLFLFDRDRLTLNACESFVDQMPVQDARVGVIGFGYPGGEPYSYSAKYSGTPAVLNMSQDASHVHEIMPVSALSTSKDREDYKQTVIDAINRGYESANLANTKKEWLYSPVVPALAAAVDMLEKNGSADNNACIILISDGISYTKKYSYDHTAVGQQARDHGWPIYSIELNYTTPSAEEVKTAEKLLDEVCAASGDRNVGRENCATPKDVFIAFQRIFFDLWKFPAPIPSNWPQEMNLPGEFPFSVPVLTSEATVNVFGSGVSSVTLVDPDGNETFINRDLETDDLIAVFKDGKYSSVKMICPTDGDWTCKVDGDGNASVLINSTDLQEMGLAIVANSASGKQENLPKNETIHVRSYFAYQGHEILNHPIYEETSKNAVVQVRHSNNSKETKKYGMQADSQGYYCDIDLSDFPCGALTLQVVLEDGMFRNNKKVSESVTFKTISQPLELTGNGPGPLEAYVNSTIEDINLQEIFFNPDGDQVTYKCTNSPDDFKFEEESDFMDIYVGMTPGSYTLKLTAQDPDMTQPLEYSLALEVTDRVPIVKRIPDVELWVDHYAFQKNANSIIDIDLSEYFYDPDGVKMTFTSKINDNSIVSARQDGSILTLTPGQEGDTVITLTGYDGVSHVDGQVKVSVISGKFAFWRDNWMTFATVAALIVLLILILIFISKNTRVKGVWTITFEENNGIPVTASNVKISTMNIGRKKVFLLKDLLGALANRLDGDVMSSLPKYFGTQKPAAQIELKGVLFGKGFIVRKIPKDDTVRVLYGGIAKQGKVQVRGSVKFILQVPGQLGMMDTMVITFK